MLSKIVNENPQDSKIAIVSHGGMINRLFQSFLELPIGTDVGIATGDTGMHHFRITQKGPFPKRIIFINSMKHL